MDSVFLSKTIHWTRHAKAKMSFYGLSESRVRRVLRNPKRVEEGVAEKTFAVMQPSSTKKRKPSALNPRSRSAYDPRSGETWTQEIWVMAQKRGRTLHIISAWRYPGVAPARNPIPIEILREVDAEGLL